MLENIKVVLGNPAPFDIDVDNILGRASYNDETHQLIIDFSDERTKFVFEKGLKRDKPIQVSVSVIGHASPDELAERTKEQLSKAAIEL